MQYPHDDLYHDRTWFDGLGDWLSKRIRHACPRHPARLWSAGFAAFAALCVAWSAALATQCVLVEMPRNEMYAHWLAAALLLVAARHFLAVTGMSAANSIPAQLRIKSAPADAAAATHAEPAASKAQAPVRRGTDEDPQQFFRAVKLAGINVRIAYALHAAGFRSADQVRAADDAALLAAPGVGPATLRKLRAQFGRPGAVSEAEPRAHSNVA